MYIVWKYKIYLVLASKQKEKLPFTYLPVSKACTNKFYISRQYTQYI